MMEDRLLTVIVPVYNKEKLLGQCLDSFAVKDFIRRLEVLVIDDGSTDTSALIAEEYERKYPEIYRVIKKENGGVGSVLNLGLQYARGKYIKEVDADDYIDINALKKLLDCLVKCDSDIVLTPYYMIDEEGELLEIHYMGGLEYGREYQAEKLLGRVGINIQSLTVKRQLLLEHNIVLEETRFYVDMQLIGESIYYAETYTVLSCILYYYRCNQAEQSVSLDSYVRNSEDFRRQTELSLERFSRSWREEISQAKRKIMKDGACGYSTLLQIIYLMDKADRNGGKCKAFDKMLEENYPVIYGEIGLQPLIRKLRNKEFGNVVDCKEKVEIAVREIQELKRGGISLGEVCSLVTGEDGNIEKYRLQKQSDKFQRQFQLLNCWLMNYQKGIRAGQYLRDRGVHRIAIYGFGALGERLYQELSDSQVQVVYGIDQRVVSKGNGFQIYKFPDTSKEIDAIVVTVIMDFIKIAADLKKIVECSVISLEDVIYRS